MYYYYYYYYITCPLCILLTVSWVIPNHNASAFPPYSSEPVGTPWVSPQSWHTKSLWCKVLPFPLKPYEAASSFYEKKKVLSNERIFPGFCNRKQFHTSISQTKRQMVRYYIFCFKILNNLYDHFCHSSLNVHFLCTSFFPFCMLHRAPIILIKMGSLTFLLHTWLSLSVPMLVTRDSLVWITIRI